MYYKIRRGLFETNSSSTHSVTLRKDFDKEFDDIKVSDDGYVHAKFDDFGWGYDRFTDSYTKLCYLLTMVWNICDDYNRYTKKSYKKDIDYIDTFYELDDFKEINDAIKEKCNCSGIIMDSSLMKKDEEYDYLSMYNKESDEELYGIDHQSYDCYKSIHDFLDEYNMSIEEFIFNPNRVLIIDNDNSPHDDFGRTYYSYENGNYEVTIYDDGTKIRESTDGTYIPEFAESIDMTITEKCNGNCPYCYAGCTPEGKHCDFNKYKDLLRSIEYGTEVAININDLSHPDLKYIENFFRYGITINITVNEKHFMEDIKKDRYNSTIKYLTVNDSIGGIGISLSSNEVSDEFIAAVKKYPNAVVHVIAGIVTADAVKKLADEKIKILVLGYKSTGRGDQYYKDHEAEINTRINDLKELINERIFDLISFDNLALEQLSIKDILSDKEWDRVYMGDDGEYTFYINLVEGYYAKSSLSTEKYPIDSDNATILFQNLRSK